MNSHVLAHVFCLSFSIYTHVYICSQWFLRSFFKSKELLVSVFGRVFLVEISVLCTQDLDFPMNFENVVIYEFFSFFSPPLGYAFLLSTPVEPSYTLSTFFGYMFVCIVIGHVWGFCRYCFWRVIWLFVASIQWNIGFFFWLRSFIFRLISTRLLIF